MMVNTVAANLKSLQQQIQLSLERFQRPPNSVTLVAVTKTISCLAIQQAIAAGQTHFGENYVQEAISKISILNNPNLTWHFIGPIQANKTKEIAQHFTWVHSVCRAKIAERLNAQRPEHLAPLNVCIQINIDDEPQKAGIHLDELNQLASVIATLPRLKLRGLMSIPKPHTTFQQQRQPYAALREELQKLQAQGFAVDTLSMGMSHDWEAAIAEGATLIRIGTAIFGERLSISAG